MDSTEFDMMVSGKIRGGLAPLARGAWAGPFRNYGFSRDETQVIETYGSPYCALRTAILFTTIRLLFIAGSHMVNPMPPAYGGARGYTTGLLI